VVIEEFEVNWSSELNSHVVRILCDYIVLSQYRGPLLIIGGVDD
jgi:hypothetical protein